MSGSGIIIMTMATKSRLHCPYMCLRERFCIATTYLENYHQCELKSSFSNKTTAYGGVLMI